MLLMGKLGDLFREFCTTFSSDQPLISPFTCGKYFDGPLHGLFKEIPELRPISGEVFAEDVDPHAKYDWRPWSRFVSYTDKRFLEARQASSTVETSVSPDRTTVVTCVLRYRHKLKLESEGQEAFAQVSGSSPVPAEHKVRETAGKAHVPSPTLMSRPVQLDYHLEISGQIQLLPPDASHLEEVLVADRTVSMVLAGMIPSTTLLTPAAYRVTTIEVIVSLTLTYGLHFLWPFVVDNDITTFTHPVVSFTGVGTAHRGHRKVQEGRLGGDIELPILPVHRLE
ncbi:hypothetical protein EHS25_005531 [Saitozyma podzolica]|uniref:Uncharacterized protein n=1 Tax=Saitozyma podzolica TaxID=1890683 RepID=A0A427XXW2_9TREE|nr:hypothetical protein EHS25_005531 [Saitozyma podzolica]